MLYKTPGSREWQGRQVFILQLYNRTNHDGKFKLSAQGYTAQECQTVGVNQQPVVPSLHFMLLKSCKRHCFPRPGKLAFPRLQPLFEILI